MPDAYFDDEYLASLYDRIESQGSRRDEEFYLGHIASAERVLDVGCGTGWLLDRARRAGHVGRLVGIDPATGMIAQARAKRDDVEWRHGYLPDAGFDHEFDLAYMTGHAFQVLLTDADIAELLAATRTALVPGGRFVFETRNPVAKAWENWMSDDVDTVLDENGRTVRTWNTDVRIDGELVSFSGCFDTDGWAEPKVSRSTLRFAPAGTLDRLLRDAGFHIDERYGDWEREPFTPHSPEIITVASTR